MVMHYIFITDKSERMTISCGYYVVSQYHLTCHYQCHQQARKVSGVFVCQGVRICLFSTIVLLDCVTVLTVLYSVCFIRKVDHLKFWLIMSSASTI